MLNAKGWKQLEQGKTYKAVAYTADLCKHDNLSALCPWCKPKWWESHTPYGTNIFTKERHGLFIALACYIWILYLIGIHIMLFQCVKFINGIEIIFK